MRHLRSVLYAIALAPAVWILCAAGFTASGGVETFPAILLVLLAGAAYATLLLAPISPLGPALAGLVFLGVALWGASAPDSYASAWPSGAIRAGFDPSRPGYGLGLLLAVPLLSTAWRARRWADHKPARTPEPVPTARAAAEPTPDTPPTPPEPAVTAPAPVSAAAPAASDEQTIYVVDSAGEATPMAALEPAPDGPTTETPEPAADHDTGEQTQVIRVHAAGHEEKTRDLRNAVPAGAAETPFDGPGERTQVIFRHQVAEVAAAQEARDRAAVEQSREAFRELAAQERSRQAFSERAARAAREHGESTQVIRLTDDTGRVEPDGDRTQVISRGDRTQVIPDDDRTQVISNGDRTQVISYPARSSEEQMSGSPPAGLSSVVGAERPDPAADPTTRLVSPLRTGTDQPDAPVDGERDRLNGFLALERPADEIADDPTRRLLPGPRRPLHDESEAPDRPS